MAYFPSGFPYACSSTTGGEAFHPSVGASDAFNTITADYRRTVVGLDLGSVEGTSSAVALGAVELAADHRC